MIIAPNSTAIVGLSLGNKLFSETYIHRLLAYCENNFERTIAMIPDLPYIHTLLARGKEVTKARTKARSNANSLANRVTRYNQKQSTDIQVQRWKELDESPIYQVQLDTITQLLESNSTFEEAVNQATSQVQRVKTDEKSIRQARQYLLKELAYLASAKDIHKSHENPTYIYHKHWSIFDRWRLGDFDNKVKSIEFQVLEV